MNKFSGCFKKATAFLYFKFEFFYLVATDRIIFAIGAGGRQAGCFQGRGVHVAALQYLAYIAEDGFYLFHNVTQLLERSQRLCERKLAFFCQLHGNIA